MPCHCRLRSSWILPVFLPSMCRAPRPRTGVRRPKLENFATGPRSIAPTSCTRDAITSMPGKAIANPWRGHCWSTGLLWPVLARLFRSDEGFRRFALGHVDTTLDMNDVEQIRAKAKYACPQNQRSVCADLKQRADAALDEDAHQRKKR